MDKQTDKNKLRGENDKDTFSIYVPIKLKDELQQLADQRDVSRNDLINGALSQWIDSETDD